MHSNPGHRERLTLLCGIDGMPEARRVLAGAALQGRAAETVFNSMTRSGARRPEAARPDA